MSIRQIQLADILLWRVTPQSALLPRTIGVVQLMCKDGRGPTLYYHASIVKDPVSYLQIEATWPRVRVSAFDPSNPDIEVWRVVGSTPTQCAVAVGVAQSHEGEWYDLGEFFFGIARSKHMEICSRLVDDSWSGAGITIVSEAKAQVTPDDLAASDKIARVS